MSWTSQAKAVKKDNDGKYIKLGSGEHVDFAVTDTTRGQETSHWLDGKKVAEGTRGAQARTQIVLCVYDLGARRCRILRLTPNTFAELAAKIDRFGEGCGYSLTRKGEGLDTRWSIDRLDKLTPQQIEAIARAEPCDPLDEVGVTEIPSGDPAPAETTDPAPERAVAPPAKAAKGRPSALPPADEDVPF